MNKERQEKSDYVIKDPHEEALFAMQIARQIAEEKLAKDPEAKILEKAIELMKKDEELLEKYISEKDPEVKARLQGLARAIENEVQGMLERYKQGLLKNKL